MRPRFVLAVVCLFSLAMIIHAEDRAFYVITLVSVKEARDIPIELALADSGMTITGRKGSSVRLEIPYSSISALQYEAVARRRYMSGAGVAALSPVTGAIIMSTKSSTHWLTVAYTEGGENKSAVLHLDKNNYQDVIDATKQKSGKTVEFVTAQNSLLKVTSGSRDVDEMLPYSVEQIRTALLPAMESVGCSPKEKKSGQIECVRGSHYSEPTGSGGKVTALIMPIGERTRLLIQSHKTNLRSRNWSTLVYEQALKNLEPRAVLDSAK